MAKQFGSDWRWPVSDWICRAFVTFAAMPDPPAKHQKCSRIRQQRKTEEWAAVMAEKAAIRKGKERRYV
jgi:hypothetical protein